MTNENALVAQMVRDAIMNDPRRNNRTPGDVFSRAKTWYERAEELRKNGIFYYSRIADKPFEEFLCEQESNLGILDFWDGDIVDYVARDSRGKDVVTTGVVRKVEVACTINGGGHAYVLFPDGSQKWIGWRELRHSKIPQDLIDIAKTQILATSKCPLLNGGDE